MEFLYAKDLKKQFNVFGHFYDLDICGQTFNCRSNLDIVSASRSVGDSKPDVVVIMMNPGSSKPESKDYIPKRYSVDAVTHEDWDDDVIPTKPDNAQYQIMRLMLYKDWRHARILNLSDLRNGNSTKFANIFNLTKSLDPSLPHSIVSKCRRKEFLKQCSNANQIIAAWGSNKVLKSIAKECIKLKPGISGIKLESPWYRYPSPYKKEQKMAWLKEITQII